MIRDRFRSRVPAFTSTASAARVPEVHGTTEVSLCGEIDLDSSSALEAQLLLACTGRPCVVKVDLSEVTFIDASGIGACLNAQQLAREQGCELVFSRPRGIVERVIRVLGLESTLLGAGSDEQ